MDGISFCSDTAIVWQTVGWFLLVFKVVIPILLIILGMIDLGKAVISSDEKAVSKAANSLLKRVIAGVVIFFIPTIVGAIFKMIGNFKTEAKAEYDVCAGCLVSPGNSEKCVINE